MIGDEGIDSLKWLKSAIPKACEGVLGFIAYRNRIYPIPIRGYTGNPFACLRNGGYPPIRPSPACPALDLTGAVSRLVAAEAAAEPSPVCVMLADCSVKDTADDRS